MKDLDNYKKGQLSEEEENNFIQKAFDAKKRLDLKAEWEQKLNQDYKVSKTKGSKTPKKKSNRNLIWYSLAAAIALLLVFLFLLPSSPNNPQQLATTFIQEEAFPYDLGTRNSSSTIELLENANTAYKNKEYQKSAQLYEQYIQNNEAKTTDYFFLGLSYLYNNQYQQSSSTLSDALQHSATENQILENEIQWYLGLSLIMENDFAKAKDILSKIQEGDWKYNSAQQLLQDL